MSKIRGWVFSGVFSTTLALLSFVAAGGARAQEIRPISEPNQSIEMGRGGYVCDGQITHSPIDATEKWTYEMVTCSGPLYRSDDYEALQVKRNHDELVKLNEALDRLNVMSTATQDMLSKQVQAFNNDLRAAIEKRFQDLPNDLLQSAAIQNLKKSLMEYVDQRLPKAPASNSPAPRTATPATGQPGVTPSQP